MKIYSVSDPLFKEYGQVVTGLNSAELLKELKKTPLPMDKTIYVPSDPKLEALAVFKDLRDVVFGGMPIQVGYCNGHNSKLNCLEYHRSSEINLGTKDFILLLGKRSEIEAGKFDTKKTRAFYVPAGTAVEVFATSLHYAPCDGKKDAGFQVLVVLPKGTNTDKPKTNKLENDEEKLLWANNKWLIAHSESSEAKAGAYVGLVGSNIDIAKDIKGE
jgi:hypothetical protein